MIQGREWWDESVVRDGAGRKTQLSTIRRGGVLEGGDTQIEAYIII